MDTSESTADSYIDILSRVGLKHPSKTLRNCVVHGFAILDASANVIHRLLISAKKAG